MELDGVLLGWLTVFTLVLVLISLMAYRRLENPRFAIVAAAFGVFFVRILGLTLDYFDELDFSLAAQLILDALALTLFFAAVWKK